MKPAASASWSLPPVPAGPVGVQEQHRRFAGAWGRALLLAGIIAAAAYFRFLGLDWDEGHHLHPDERFLSQVESALRPVSSFEEYLDTGHSSLNPNNKGFGFFVYGDFPIILVRYLGAWLPQADFGLSQRILGRELGSGYDAAYLVGRGLSALSDVISVFVVFLIGRQLYGVRTGTLAAALYGAAVLPIQQSHFCTVDAIANLFVVTAFWFAARAVGAARWSDDICFGVSVGLGMASKISVAPVALLLPVAAALRPRTSVRGAVIRGAMGFNLAAAVAVLTFRLAQPYAFLPAHGTAPLSEPTDIVGRVLTDVVDVIGPQINAAWVKQLQELDRAMSGNTDQPPNHQWATRTPLLFPWVNMVRFGMGWPLGLAAWFGCVWALWEVGRRHGAARQHVLPLTWVVLFFLWQGSRWAKCMRYLFPIYPILAIMAASIVSAMIERAAESGRRRRLATAVACAIVFGTYAWAFAFTRIYTRPHPRIAASRWIYEHAPSDVTLALATPEGGYTQQIGLPNNWTPPHAKRDDPVAPAISSTFVGAQRPYAVRFVPARGGTLVSVTFCHILDPIRDGAVRSLRVDVATASGGRSVLTTATLSAAFVGDATRGASFTVQLPSVQLEGGRPYSLILTPQEGPLLFSGSAIATEGSWDDALPLPMTGLDPYGVQYQNYALQMSWDDTPQKRARLEFVLAHADYIVISSNRFYDALSRNPRRWPMTLEYYRALFNGELGFELAAAFSSQPNLGPLEIDDRWAEETFTVYDHPRVFVFRKTAQFSDVTAAAVLTRADLNQVVRRRAVDVRDAPVVLALPTVPQ